MKRDIKNAITSTYFIYESEKWKLSRSVMSDSAIPWTVAYQVPPSMGFSRQEYWSGLPFPSPGIFPTQGLNPGLPHGRHCRQTLYHLSHQERSKAEEPEIKLPTSAGSSKKQESSRKTSISALLTMPKPLTVWITINCGKFWKRWEHRTTWPASWETCMQVRKQQLELDMEQQVGSK